MEYRHTSVDAHFIIPFIREAFALCCTAKDVRNHLSTDFDFSAKKPSKNSKTSGRENEIFTKPKLTLPFGRNKNPFWFSFRSLWNGGKTSCLERNASVGDPHTKQGLRHTKTVKVGEGANNRSIGQTRPHCVALLQESAGHVSILIVKLDTYTITICLTRSNIEVSTPRSCVLQSFQIDWS